MVRGWGLVEKIMNINNAKAERKTKNIYLRTLFMKSIILLIGVLLNMTDLLAEESSTSSGITGRPLEIVRMGHPALRQKAKEVADPTSLETRQIVADMMATIDKTGKETVAGLAAPQVDIPLRILLFQVPEQKADESQKSLPFTVVINPVIEPLDVEKVLGWEGCLSLPGLVGEVPRYKRIKYSYKTLEGKTITREVSGFHAKVIQHEVDHLDGILYVDRMEDMKRLYCDKEFQEFVVKPAMAKKRAPAPIPTGESSLAVPGGKIWYKVSGTGKGIPVVILHGGPGMSSIYLKVFDDLGNDRQVVRYDQLGGGKSDKITDKALFTIDHFVKELELLRIHLGVEKWHVLGHSFGTIIALEYYRAYPERVSSLIFSSSSLDIKGLMESTRRLLATLPAPLQNAVKKAESMNNYNDPMYKKAVDQFYSLYYWRHPVKADLDSLFATFNTEICTYMLRSGFTVTGTIKDYNPLSFLPQIKVPTMFTVGEFDAIAPDIVKKQADKVPGAKYRMFRGSGHMTSWDARDENLKAVREFLQSADTSSGS